jgi:hypothetical protein
LISHRGNVCGKDPSKENTVEYVERALSLGYHSEIDVWSVDNKYYLGHDNPTTEIGVSWIIANSKLLWVHCKNIDCLYTLYSKNIDNLFFHNTDDVVLTSSGYLWTYPGKKLTPRSIAVLPEGKYTDLELTGCFGICSDVINSYH